MDDRPASRSPAVGQPGAVAALYGLAMAGWLVAGGLFGDRWHWLFLLNSFAVYLFLPGLALPLVAWRSGQRWPWLLGCGLLIVWLSGDGGLLLPRRPSTPTGASVLTVMSYNMLAANYQTSRIVATIEAADADVVAIQELNHAATIALLTDLSARYPYQVLDPHDDTSGMGVISRYPIRAVAESPLEGWRGSHQLLALDLAGQPVHLINMHAVAPAPPLAGDHANWLNRQREAEAQAIVDWLRRHPGPAIVLGDLNATPRSHAYASLAVALDDAWRQAGWGLGHTWPGAASPGSPVPTLFGLTAPLWLVRIDYVLVTRHWQTTQARLGDWDGVSDHRPVLARLSLRPERQAGLGGEGGLAERLRHQVAQRRALLAIELAQDGDIG